MDFKDHTPNDYDHYERMVAALVKPGKQIKREMSNADAHLWHMATGVVGEAGELIDAVKKAVIYRKPIDKENVKEELGDLRFYITAIYQIFGFTDEEIREANYAKLSTRYAGLKYSNRSAVRRRDKDGAAKIKKAEGALKGGAKRANHETDRGLERIVDEASLIATRRLERNSGIRRTPSGGPCPEPSDRRRANRRNS